jgi:putative hydrolase of the HAD superfamily
MALLLIDLDNTLVDRDAAFRAAVEAFLDHHGLPDSDVAWVMNVDASGYTPRDAVASAMTDRYHHSAPVTAIRTLLDHGAVDRVSLARTTRNALAGVRAHGWTCVIVTNGRTAQQELKIRNTGLDRWVDGWVVSQAVGHKKPAPQIFHAAAELAGSSLDDAWVIGDSPAADIAGAAALGLRSVWVSRGESWALRTYRPSYIADDCASAIHHATLIESRESR